MNLKVNFKPLYNKWVDTLFILLPPFWCVGIVFLLPNVFKSNADMPLAAWVILVMCVDVAHVYSTLFRTYFSSNTLKQHGPLLRVIPMVCLLSSFMLYSLGSQWFWTVFAYIAVFHFVRQQYGFMRLYASKDVQTKTERLADNLMIYAATLYPILHWHLTGNRNFSWFTPDDFFMLNLPMLVPYFKFIYFIIVLVYVVFQITYYKRSSSINLPKQVIVLGTALSWYLGIVYFNGDLVFTLLNVVSHGIPYMALVWIWGRKSTQKQPAIDWFAKVFKPKGILIFASIILFLAFAEELFWDAWVWHEHQQVFAWFQSLQFEMDEGWLKLIVPLLSLPQLTHYVIDGFIWKIKKDEYQWANQVLE